MDIKATCIKAFNETLKNSSANSELKKSLRSHPKTKDFLSRVIKQMTGANAINVKRTGKAFRYNTINEAVRDLTLLMIQGLEDEAHKRMESSLEKLAREEKLQKANDLEKSAEGTLVGDYEELKNGVTILETQTEDANASGTTNKI